MTFSLTPDDVLRSTIPPKKPYLVGLIILLCLTVLGLALIAHYAISQRETALLGVQRMMSGVSDVRSDAIANWVRQQHAVLQKFAQDQDVRMSVTQIQEPSADLDLSSRGYLRNWLADLAREHDFLPPDMSRQVEANVPSTSESGLAIFSKDGSMIANIGLFPSSEDAVKTFVKNYTVETSSILDLFKGKDGQIYIGFAQPIFGINGGTTENERIAMVLGVKLVDGELWPLLGQPGSVVRSGQVFLLEKSANQVRILSPFDGGAALSRQFDISKDSMVEVKSVLNPGQFAEGINYGGEWTIAVSRTVAGTPWTVSYQVNYKELMHQTEQNLLYQKVIFLLILLAVLGLLYGTWRRGVAKIASEKAVEYASLARRFDFQGRLMKLVTDTQHNHIILIDADGRVRFANATLARDMGMSAEDMLGKPLASVVGAEAARRLSRRAHEAEISNRPIFSIERIEPGTPAAYENDQETHVPTALRVVQTQHIPVQDNSLGPDQPISHGTLIVEDDITELVKEREKREKVLRGVVDAMISVVDRRDPYAAEHSGRVARLSRQIAVEMGLDETMRDSVEMAGALLNFGKLLVPAQLLTKETALDEAELKVVRDSLLSSAEILSPISFDGPVIETLRQIQEKVDGSGFPQGLQGDQIIVSARIVSVANAFVALISSRAHRSGMSLDTALGILLKQVDLAYDRAVIAALVNYLDNKGGRDEWEFMAPPPDISTLGADNPWLR